MRRTVQSLHHLDHIQQSLKLDAEAGEADLESIFG